MAVFIQTVWASVPTAEVNANVEAGITVIVPLKLTGAHPPDVVTVN